MRTCPKIALLAGLTALSFGCHSAQQPGQAAPRRSPVAASADQTNAPLLPDPKMTPGATLPVTRADICVPGYTQKVRNVPLDVKKQVYAEYGIQHHKAGDYEVDHLISLELGGSNSIKNLWPQSYLTQPWNAHVKDALENEMHAEVCDGRLDLATAQHDISTDWIAAYKKYFHTSAPLSSAGAVPGRRSPHAPQPPPPDGRRLALPRSARFLPPRQAASAPAAGSSRTGVGQHQVGQVLSPRLHLLRQHQAGPVHDRSAGAAAGLRRGQGTVSKS